MALTAQALEAQKASKPLEQGGALEQVAARIERVMGLTNKSNRRLQAVRVDCRVRTKPTQQLPKANSIAEKIFIYNYHPLDECVKQQ